MIILSDDERFMTNLIRERANQILNIARDEINNRGAAVGRSNIATGVPHDPQPELEFTVGFEAEDDIDREAFVLLENDGYGFRSLDGLFNVRLGPL